MKLTKLIAFTTLAAAGLALTPTLAAATPAEATTAVNVRSGPGGSYSKVDTLHAGEDVTIDHCNASSTWCYVTHTGPDGWVSANYLAPTGGGGGGAPAVTPDKPNCSFKLGPSGFAITCGDSSVNLPLTPPVVGKACFYKGFNYSGAKFCVPVGTKDASLPPAWNDKISSFKLFDGAKVRLCRNFGYNSCKNRANSNPSLGVLLNNRISSYKVN